MKATWKKAAGCTLFILILLLTLVLLSGLCRPRSIQATYDLNPYRYNGIFAEPNNSLDIIFTGNSLCYNGVSPMELWKAYGITSYACGCDDQTMPRIYENLTWILDCQSPALVILEADVLFRDLKYEDLLRMRLDLALPVLSYHDLWRKVPLHATDDRLNTRYVDDTKGYYIRHDIKAFEKGAYMIPTEETAPIPGPAVTCLKDLQKLCRKKGTHLMLLSIPSPANWDYPRHNAVQSLANAQGIPYLDMNLLPKEELAIDWSRHSWDHGDHLNYDGSRVSMLYLGDRLQTEYDLPDHRKDPLFQEWHVSEGNYDDWVESGEYSRIPLLRELEP